MLKIALMPSSSTLIHPICCPFCGQVSAHSFECLEHFEVDNDDLHLGEKIVSRDPRLRQGFRTQGHSLCLLCQNSIHALLSIRKNKIIRIEVFPQICQTLLDHFPSCLFLNPQDDADLVLLSDLLQQTKASSVAEAVRRASVVYFDDAFWEKKKQQSKMLHRQAPNLDNLSLHLSDEDFSSATAKLLEEVDHDLDEATSQAAEQTDYLREQKKRHNLLQQILAQSSTR